MFRDQRLQVNQYQTFSCKNPHRIGAQDAARKTLRVLPSPFARDETIGLLGAG
jgi:hypothetical protein